MDLSQNTCPISALIQQLWCSFDMIKRDKVMAVTGKSVLAVLVGVYMTERLPLQDAVLAKAYSNLVPSAARWSILGVLIVGVP